MNMWLATVLLLGQATGASTVPLETKGVSANPTVAVSDTTYKGQRAVRALDVSGTRPLHPIVLLKAARFHNGTIEADVAGLPAAGAGEGARGFVGIAFRVQQDSTRYNAFYIRPTNGRADDQLRRNHSTQYISMPNHPWHRLREEQPGVYESYADLMPGEWTKLRIEVAGDKARLFVGGASEPALIVNDLLGNRGPGGVALWIGDGTEAYFSNVRVTRTD